jgi:hypothetical protein
MPWKLLAILISLSAQAQPPGMIPAIKVDPTWTACQADEECTVVDRNVCQRVIVNKKFVDSVKSYFQTLPQVTCPLRRTHYRMLDNLVCVEQICQQAGTKKISN